MDYGFKISKTGYDVNTATPTQLVYSSKWSNFKIKEIITASLVSTGAVDSVAIANPLPYPPFFLAFIEDTTNFPGKWQPSTLGAAAGTVDVTGGMAAMPQTYYRSGTNDFHNSVSTVTVGDTYTFKIVVFIDDPVGGVGYSSPRQADYGIKVAKEGMDISMADTDMSMSSKFSNLTIFATGQVLSTSGVDTLEITHGLGYPPMHMVLIKDNLSSGSNNWQYLPNIIHGPVEGVGHCHSYVDSNKLYISPANTYDFGGTATNYLFKYIIFNERIV